MTDIEIQSEWRYRIAERLGIMCEDRPPTSLQKLIAMREANAAILALSATDESEPVDA